MLVDCAAGACALISYLRRGKWSPSMRMRCPDPGTGWETPRLCPRIQRLRYLCAVLIVSASRIRTISSGVVGATTYPRSLPIWRSPLIRWICKLECVVWRNVHYTYTYTYMYTYLYFIRLWRNTEFGEIDGIYIQWIAYCNKNPTMVDCFIVRRISRRICISR